MAEGKKRITVGIIGCGNISDIYLTNLGGRFSSVQLAACADALPERAKAKAERFGIAALGVEELLAAPDIDLVVNLTIPAAHAAVTRAALEAGKHVYTEKPLATRRAEGAALLALAEERGLRLGGAPDTFLGAGISACKTLLDSGTLGPVIGGTANMLCPGHESWHPDPAFYYAAGGGPVLDMGPYYLTALTELLGPVESVLAFQSAARAERTIGSGPNKGRRIPVEVPTHTAGLLRFQSGAVVTLTMSFDVQASRLPPIELWGAAGSLAVPDPNTFGGPVLLHRAGETGWTEMPVGTERADNARGLGVEDLALSILEGTPERASGRRCLHVLDVMEGLSDAAAACAAHRCAAQG